jgi:xanthine/CO dehydrogenase XdhC/CoxF family maturation factor
MVRDTQQLKGDSQSVFKNRDQQEQKHQVDKKRCIPGCYSRKKLLVQLVNKQDEAQVLQQTEEEVGDQYIVGKGHQDKIEKHIRKEIGGRVQVPATDAGPINKNVPENNRMVQFVRIDIGAAQICSSQPGEDQDQEAC